MTEYKQAEKKIQEWLDRPEDGYCLDRIPDQMTGLYGSKNICDFTLFKSPNFYYIESKATWESRFDFSLITDYQYKNMLKKSKINNVYGWIVVLYLSHKRAFIFNIQDIDVLQKSGKKSLNIDKIDKWSIPYFEIPTVNSNKKILDYSMDVEVDNIVLVLSKKGLN